MQIHLIAIGKKMPHWIAEGFNEYAKRLSSDYLLKLIEINAPKRSKNCSVEKIKRQEGELLLKQTMRGDYIIALHEIGKAFDTKSLAYELQKQREKGQSISLLIGGADGLSEACLNAADDIWSLSKLTFPHMLVRVIIAEQLYRATTLLSHHPYHR